MIAVSLILYELLSMVGGSAESEYERAAAVPVPPPPPHVDPYYIEVIFLKRVQR